MGYTLKIQQRIDEAADIYHHAVHAADVHAYFAQRDFKAGAKFGLSLADDTLKANLDLAIKALDRIFCYEHIDAFSFQQASDALTKLKPENYLIDSKLKTKED